GNSTVAQENSGSLLLAFELSSVFNEIARRQIDLTRDLLLRFCNQASQISTCHVRLNDNAPLNPLTIDEIRPILKTNFRYLTERDLNAIVAINEDSFHRLGITAGGLVEPDKKVEALLIFDDLRDSLSVESDLGRFKHVSRVEPETCSPISI